MKNKNELGVRGEMLTIELNHQSKEPFYEQIYKYIRDEIKSGMLRKQTKLPSSRGLASYLSISRNTVDMAYSQLISEGYIESVPKKGYYVCELEQEFSKIPLEDDWVEEIEEEEHYMVDFSPNGVDMENFPYNQWRKLMKEVTITDNSELFQSGDPQGDLEFRKTIRLYLHQSRGVNCQESQIIVGAGMDYLLLILGMLFDKTKKIAFEEPVYPQAYQVFRSLGFERESIALDSQGMVIEDLECSGCDIAYVTPSHQYPTGVVMPISRRLKLLAWANEKEGRYIIEDDYDSEFRYHGRPIPALQGNDRKGNVIYLGTFSKGIAPAIRVSYMVLPQSLYKEFKKKCGFYSSTVSRIDQAVINHFMTKGHFERHLNRMRGIYRSKHDCLVQELKKFGDKIRIFGESAGLHLLVQYLGEKTEEELIQLAKGCGIKVYPLSNYMTEKKTIENPVMILGFARLSEEDIKKGISVLIKVW